MLGRAHDPALIEQVRLRRRWRRVVGVLVALAGVCGVTFALSWSLTRGQPAWWREPAGDAAAQAAMAQALENGVVSVLSTARPEGAVWVAHVRTEDANAWLASRLPKWLAAQSPPIVWPREVESVQVGFEDGAIYLGARVRTAGDAHYLSVRVEPELRGDGSLWARATSVRIGRLVLPAGLVLSRAGRASTIGSALLSGEDLRAALATAPQAEAAVRALLGGLPVVREPRVRLGDGRTVRLTGVDARDGRLVLTCSTGTR